MAKTATAHFRRAARVKKSRTHERVYDKVIVGGGIAGLAAAYQLALAGQKVAVLTDRLNWPQDGGSHIVFGLDGNTVEDAELHPNAKTANALIRNGMQNLLETVRRENISCQADMGYQLVGHSEQYVEDRTSFIAERMGYDRSKLRKVGEADRLKAAGFPFVRETDEIGQINMPELINGLVAAIKKMGGDVIEGVRYKNRQTKTLDGVIRVQTDKGIFQSKTPILLATSAQHLSGLPSFQRKMEEIGVGAYPIYVIAAQIPLSAEDRQKIIPNGRPMAFVQTGLDESVLTQTGEDLVGGGIDRKGVLSFGWAWCEKQEDVVKRQAKLKNIFETVFPDLKDKYLFPNADGTYSDPGGKFKGKTITFSVGTQLEVENGLPIVGPLSENCDVHSGFGSRAIVQQWAVAMAYAKKLQGDDVDYRIFESLNMTPMPPAPVASQTARVRSNRSAPSA
jgi:glycine/D-amino acid oxidase-like deaminating enzyme